LSSARKSIKIGKAAGDTVKDSMNIEDLERRLNGPRPGLKAQMRMMPRPRPGGEPCAGAEAAAQKAGVTILLYPKEGELFMAFIRRSGMVLHHKDQIGFPGGEVESGESYEQAALRETWEELGVEPERLRVIGVLTPLYIARSNFRVHPIVAVSKEPLCFKPEEREVAEVIEVPLGHLADPRRVRRETHVIDGVPVEIPYYPFRGHKIWGATAMILAEFLEMTAGPSQP